MATGSCSRCVILAQSAGNIDHFPHVAEALNRHGFQTAHITAGARPVRLDDSAAALVVADTESSQSRYLLAQAQAHGVPTMLLMDGILEWRNTFCNPAVPADFLRPAPVDVIACAGEIDQALLQAWGNRAVATGLPRLYVPNRNRPAACTEPETILVATARHPWFSSAEREQLLTALSHLTQIADTDQWIIRWRIAPAAAAELGIRNDTLSSLDELLTSARAVITTPSTLMVESMQAGVPTCLLNPFGTPCWQQAAWHTRGQSVPEWQFALRHLSVPDTSLIDRQNQIVRRLHMCNDDPAARLADLVADLTSQTCPHRAGTVHVRGSIRPTLNWPKPTRPRVISCIVCDGSPVGGVTTWSVRLAREFARRDLPYDVRTVLIGTHADACDRSLLLESDRDRDLIASLIVDPTLDQVQFLDQLRHTFEEVEPSIILPNYADFCYAVAMQMRADKVRTLAVAHSDDWYYRHLTSVYHDWDAAVGVSRMCTQWLETTRRSLGHGPRPIQQITYGIPIARTIRERRSEPKKRPIALAYVGRMVNHQKRLDHFVPLTRHLIELGVSFHLHMIGDGPDMDGCRTAIGRLPLRSPEQTVTWHGRRSPEWTITFLRNHVDVSILLSDFEGTSITMLEAMGQGVVPAVTDVDSGVNEWIQDNGNGIVVDVGRPDQMAQRIARLTSHDVNSLGQAAWETCRDRQAGIDTMADRYRSVFDEVMALPIPHPVPYPALGWSLTDDWRWTKTWADHPEAGNAAVRSQLESAGCTRIFDGYPTTAEYDSPSPTPGPAVALVDTSQHEMPTQDVRDAWSAQGLETVLLPTLLTGSAANTLAQQMACMRHALEHARADGAQRIAIYGIGKHTQRLHDVLSSQHDIVCFIDDQPSTTGGQVWDRPVCSLDQVMARLNPDAVILSSDAWERRMWRKCEPLRRQGVAVYALYGSDKAIEKQRRVVVSTVYCDPTPVGGVTIWSLRMTEACAVHPELGCDCHTVLICPTPLLDQVQHFADSHLHHKPAIRPFVHVLPVDIETSDHIDILDAVRRAIESLDPDVILPNYTDLTYAVATQIRQARRTHTLAIAHADDPYYQKLLTTYDRWDAAVGVSDTCLAWIQQQAIGRPVRTRQIVYGVPPSSVPRTVTRTDGPLQLAYVGRMVQHQKRVFEFVELVRGLESLGTKYHLHMVGDGPDLDACRNRMNDAVPGAIDRVTWHGSRSSAWVQQFWPTIDVAVLLSDFEGTSITMLEAMAHGVVPAVTEVRSGVSEWINDDVHGIIVPNDQSPADAMAWRLHALSLDRSHLTRMGSNAWQRINDRHLTVDHMATQYATLFDEVLAGENGDGLSPTDTSLRLTDRTRWKRQTTDQLAHVNQRIREWFAEAGYARIVELEHGQSPDLLEATALDASTAVIVHTQGDGTTLADDEWFESVERSAARWRSEWGVGIVYAPHLFERPELEPHGTILRALRRAVADGRQRIVLFGVGKHTQRLLAVVSENRFPIVGFMDDNPPPDLLADGLAGRPVVRAERVFEDLYPDCIILSSDAWERQMWDRCMQLKAEHSAEDVAVIALYGEYNDQTVERADPMILQTDTVLHP